MAALSQLADSNPGDILVVLHNFAARSPDELNLRRGDRIELVEKDDEFGDGWFIGKHLTTGQRGLFPEVYTKPAPNAPGSPLAFASSSAPASAVVTAPEAPSAQALSSLTTTTKTAQALHSLNRASSTSSSSSASPSQQLPPPQQQQLLDSLQPHSSNSNFDMSPPSSSHGPLTASSYSGFGKRSGHASNLSNRSVSLGSHTNNPVMSETLSVIEEHITDMNSPIRPYHLELDLDLDDKQTHTLDAHQFLHMSQQDKLEPNAAPLNFQHKPPTNRLSYINGDETDEEDATDFTEEEVREWSPMQVAEYLEQIGADRSHCQVFKDQEISGDLLMEIDKDTIMLKDFDLGTLGRRLALFKKIQRFQQDVRRNNASGNTLSGNNSASNTNVTGSSGQSNNHFSSNSTPGVSVRRTLSGGGTNTTILPRIPSLLHESQSFSQQHHHSHHQLSPSLSSASAMNGNTPGVRQRAQSTSTHEMAAAHPHFNHPHISNNSRTDHRRGHNSRPSVSSAHSLPQSRRHSSVDASPQPPPSSFPHLEVKINNHIQHHPHPPQYASQLSPVNQKHQKSHNSIAAPFRVNPQNQSQLLSLQMSPLSQLTHMTPSILSQHSMQSPLSALTHTTSLSSNFSPDLESSSFHSSNTSHSPHPAVTNLVDTDRGYFSSNESESTGKSRRFLRKHDSTTISGAHTRSPSDGYGALRLSGVFRSSRGGSAESVQQNSNANNSNTLDNPTVVANSSTSLTSTSINTSSTSQRHSFLSNRIRRSDSKTSTLPSIEHPSSSALTSDAPGLKVDSPLGSYEQPDLDFLPMPPIHNRSSKPKSRFMSFRSLSNAIISGGAHSERNSANTTTTKDSGYKSITTAGSTSTTSHSPIRLDSRAQSVSSTTQSFSIEDGNHTKRAHASISSGATPGQTGTPLPSISNEKAPRRKGKHETSAYLRGLEKKVPNEQIPGSAYSGWMKKKSRKLGKWHPRLFVLRGCRLSYYYSEDDMEEKGVIDISYHRVLPASKDLLSTFYDTITGSAANGSSTGTLVQTAAEVDLATYIRENGIDENSNDSMFVFKLVPPRAGMSRGPSFTEPKVHFFAVGSVHQGRCWMAALMKATIEHDERRLVSSTYKDKTMSLSQAQDLRVRPAELVDVDQAVIEKINTASTSKADTFNTDELDSKDGAHEDNGPTHHGPETIGGAQQQQNNETVSATDSDTERRVTTSLGIRAVQDDDQLHLDLNFDNLDDDIALDRDGGQRVHGELPSLDSAPDSWSMVSSLHDNNANATAVSPI